MPALVSQEGKALPGISYLVLVHEATRSIVGTPLAEEQFMCLTILLVRHLYL